MSIYYIDERPIKPPEKRFSPNSSSASSYTPDPLLTDLIPQPTVTIMVESPKEAPNSGFSMEPRMPIQTSTSTNNDSDISSTNYVVEISSPVTSPVETSATSTIINIDEPIDVNIPRDTTNIFYDYIESSPVDNISISESNQQHSDHEAIDIDAIHADVQGTSGNGATTVIIDNDDIRWTSS